MAERRMFAKTIIDSDAFLDMPLSAQALYFHLSMRADDDGFINNPKKLQRVIGASEDDLKLLIAKNFIIPFESGVVVIKHWRIHNLIPKDRYHETVYVDEKAKLSIKENKAYTVLNTECIQNDNRMETQDSIGKVSIDNNNIYNGDSDVSQMPKSSSSHSESADAEALFECLWQLYPKKKGKGQVSLSAKKRLLKVGQDELTRCIERYKEDCIQRGVKEQFVMYGSTFFNSGYVDYLDANFEDNKIITAREPTESKWQTLPQRENRTEQRSWQ